MTAKLIDWDKMRYCFNNHMNLAVVNVHTFVKLPSTGHGNVSMLDVLDNLRPEDWTQSVCLQWDKLDDTPKNREELGPSFIEQKTNPSQSRGVEEWVWYGQNGDKAVLLEFGEHAIYAVQVGQRFLLLGIGFGAVNVPWSYADNEGHLAAQRDYCPFVGQTEECKMSAPQFIEYVYLAIQNALEKRRLGLEGDEWIARPVYVIRRSNGRAQLTPCNREAKAREPSNP